MFLCSVERGGSQQDLKENSTVKIEGQICSLINPVVSLRTCFVLHLFPKNLVYAHKANLSLCQLISDSND